MKKCRVCKSSSLEKFNFKHKIFPEKKDKNCENYFCINCKSISHYYIRKKNLYKNYRIAGSFYENGKLIKPPISLPWSTITFKRSQQIIQILRKYTSLKK